MVIKNNQPIETIISHGKKYLEKENSRKEKIEKLLGSSSKATNFKSWLSSRIGLAVLNKDIETEIILREISKRYRGFRNLALVEIEIIEGWKGIDNIEIMEGFT